MFNKKYFWERLSIIAGLVATIVSVYSLWVQHKPESISISMSILSSEKVTDVEMVPGVKANFTYEGRDVLGLWKVKFRLTNSSGRNLIGTGVKSDLLYDSIPLLINEQFKIIDITSEADSIGLVSNLKADDIIEVSFEQWSETESATLVMYLEQLNSENIAPSLEVHAKSLINGQVIVTDNSDSFYTVKKKKPRFELPSWLDISTGLITSITLYTCIGVIFSLVWTTPYEYIRLKKWKFTYLSSFEQHIDSIAQDIDHAGIVKMLESYKNQPYKAPNWVWETFKGQSFTSSPVTETVKSTVIVFVVSFVVLVSFALKLFV
ncbi:conserved membrane hypothetical protein [Vibrio chagasii]|nr:conserved membrane hypothetical protein [Vibrio chagasii]